MSYDSMIMCNGICYQTDQVQKQAENKIVSCLPETVSCLPVKSEV